jgi:uncharacterized membrane protein YedE/YeeE
MQILVAYIIGLLFGIGIAVSGMANPAKVLNFFDIAGSWDPSLAFVMGGALLVTLLGYRLVLRRRSPLLDDRFHLPSTSGIDGRLISGSVLFGIGWGITGFCPGGAIPALGSGRHEVMVFMAGMIAGAVATRLALGWRTRSNPQPGR